MYHPPNNFAIALWLKYGATNLIKADSHKLRLMRAAAAGRQAVAFPHRQENFYIFAPDTSAAAAHVKHSSCESLFRIFNNFFWLESSKSPYKSRIHAESSLMSEVNFPAFD